MSENLRSSASYAVNHNPKSTVEVGCEELIRVENTLRSPLSSTCYRPISTPKIKGFNQTQNRLNRKYFIAGCHAARPLRLLATPQFKSVQPIQGYSNLLQPIQVFLGLPPGGVYGGGRPYHPLPSIFVWHFCQPFAATLPTTLLYIFSRRVWASAKMVVESARTKENPCISLRASC